MRNNNQSNKLIKWMVTLGDFIVLNILIWAFVKWHWQMSLWDRGLIDIFILVNNIALMLSMLQFSTIVYLRVVGAGDMLKRVICLATMQSVLTFLLLKVFVYSLPIGQLVFELGLTFMCVLLVKRLIERCLVKWFRGVGRNTRMVTLVGSDPELLDVQLKLTIDPSLGYKIINHFENTEEFMMAIETQKQLILGEELYLCVPRSEKEQIQRISRLCDSRVVRFYYVPVSVESIGLNFKRELLDDIEVFTTYENPMLNMVNKAVKRLFDIVLSIMFLLFTALIFPFIWIIIKIQSPGPVFFTQERTGQNGRVFRIYKFRSMFINREADQMQTTKDDPRKFPFGSFMRKSSIDELPQFWNVLRGDMSIVGPRPHMLAHTEMYSQLINKYMVRHFVKPGITGWAQVNGFRGETKELWQMEERVKRDIWYMENWSIWLDIRIIWQTVKLVLKHDKNAY